MAYHPTCLRVLGTGPIPVRGHALIARGGRSCEYEPKPVYPRALITEIGPGDIVRPAADKMSLFATPASLPEFCRVALSLQMQKRTLVRGHAILDKSSAGPILAARCSRGRR